MSESVLIPIFLGFAVNVILFLISLYVFKKSAFKATHLTFIVSVLVLASSFIIGSWLGMGIGLVSLGMLLCSAALYIFNFTSFKNLLAK